MILLDYSQVAISNLHQQLKYGGNTNQWGRCPTCGTRCTCIEEPTPSGVQPDLLRHMILSSIRKTNRQFGKKYGPLVICSDNNNYWRKSYFKFYKANRKKDRDDSGIDWKLVFQTLSELRNELRAVFPYKVLDVPMAEADDVIGVLVKHFHQHELILILSGDKDFQQLQVYPDVEQYSPVQDKFMKPDGGPILFLKEHIIRGDKGDGIPNFLSPDNSFVDNIKQKSIFEAKLKVWLRQQPEEFCDETTLLNYRRNEMLVDLSKIPAEVEAAILEEYAKPIVGGRDKIFSYLVKHKMKNLLENIREF